MQKVVTFDNFLPHPRMVRNEFINLPFYNIRGPDGEMYKKISMRPTDEFSPELEQAIGRKVSRSYSMARLNYAGELPNNAIHSDDAYDPYALIIYLNLPHQCKGGTAFWRHRKTGFEQMPTEAEIKSKGKSPVRIFQELSDSWNDASKWEQVGIAEMKFNRAVIFPTNVFHSRFPFEAFGTGPEDGRLIFCSFFSLV